MTLTFENLKKMPLTFETLKKMNLTIENVKKKPLTFENLKKHIEAIITTLLLLFLLLYTVQYSPCPLCKERHLESLSQPVPQLSYNVFITSFVQGWEFALWFFMQIAIVFWQNLLLILKERIALFALLVKNKKSDSLFCFEHKKRKSRVKRTNLKFEQSPLCKERWESFALDALFNPHPCGPFWRLTYFTRPFSFFWFLSEF